MSRPLRILVAVKRVPAPGAQINIADNGTEVDTAFLGFTTSPHEECAVEAAVQLVEGYGGEATVITLGPAEAEEQLRYAVSVGMTKGVLLPIDGADWDPMATADALTDVIRELESADGPFDVILFGNESADSGGFQVGIRVGNALGRPTVNGAKRLQITDETAEIGRQTDQGQEIYRVELPCVVGVKEGINLPRYPTMKGRLASKKAEVTTVAPTHRPGALTMVRLEQPVEQATETVILGHGPEAAAAVVDVLEELGVM